MKSTNIHSLNQITQKAIREIPKTWQRLGSSYLHKVTRKDIFRVNALAIFVGVSTGYAAIGFRKLIGLLQNGLLFNQFDFHLADPSQHTIGFWMLVAVPAGLIASTLLTRWFAPEAKGHGVPEVIEAVLTQGGRIRKRIVAIKALASGITIASGGSVGREGPIVQIGSAIGSTFGQFFHFSPRLIKTLVGCGAAGAISATFNTPIAGVIFAVEVIVLELKTKSFVPLVTSSVFAAVISRFHLGNEPAFFVPQYSLKGPSELIFYIAFGIIAGLVGAWLIRILYGIEDLVDKIKCHFLLKPIVGGLLIASVGLIYPQIFGVGYEAMTQVLQQNMGLGLVVTLLLLKPLTMSLTLACGGSGGVFAPSLFVGAMLGGSFGVVVHHFFPEMTASHGAYALVGMAAVFSATSRATFTAIVVLFEMTLDYSIILPLMLVCVIADQFSWVIQKDSIYALKLRRKGLKYINDIGVNVMGITLVRDIMTTEIQMASLDMTIEEAVRVLLPTHHSIYPVVTEDKKLCGVVHWDNIQEAHNQGETTATLSDFIQKAKAKAYPDETVLEAVRRIEKERDPRILVIDRQLGTLKGIVSPIDFVRLSSSDEN
ncbi:chloride channel protein [Bdellovibrionales bacterium]|nr:chloride channel protein [Bdellovibrionales bacterium]